MRRYKSSDALSRSHSTTGLVTGLVEHPPTESLFNPAAPAAQAAHEAAEGGVPSDEVHPVASHAVSQFTGVNPADIGKRLGTGDYGGAVGSVLPQVAVAILLHKAMAGRGLPDAETPTETPSVPSEKVSIDAAPSATPANVTTTGPSVSIPGVSPDVATRLTGLSRLAGKEPAIDVTKINSPESVTAAIDNLSRNLDPRVGHVIGLDAQKQLASDLGMSTDELLSRRSGQAFNAEQAIAARSVLRASQNNVIDLAQRAVDDPTQLQSFNDALARHRMIADEVQGMTAEAGRALGSFRVPDEELPSAKIAGAMSKLSPEQAGEAARLLAKTDTSNPAAVNRFVSEITPSTTLDKLHEGWLESLLTSAAIPKKIVADLTMTMKAPLEKMLGGTPSDAIHSVQGMFSGFSNAVDAFAHSFKYETSASHGEFSEPTGAIKGQLGRIVRLPTRSLQAITEFFHQLNVAGSLHEQAYRIAGSEGLSGDALHSRVADLIANPTDEMRQTAFEYGQRQTFQAPDAVTKALGNLRAIPGMRWIVPFTRTPWNLARQAFETSPAGFLETGAKLFQGEGLDHQLLGRNMLGTAAFAWGVSKALNGEMTGAGPTSSKERLALEQTGWQPYSVRVGNRWVAIKYWEPIAPTLMAAADFAEQSKRHPETDHTDMLIRGISIGAKDAVEALPFATTLTNAADAMKSENEGKVASFVGHQLGSVVPGGVADLAHAMDRTVRVPDRNADFSTRIAQILESRIPGASRNVPALLAPNGQPIQRPVSALGGANPFAVSEPISPAQLNVSSGIDRAERTRAIAQQRKIQSQRIAVRRQP